MLLSIFLFLGGVKGASLSIFLVQDYNDNYTCEIGLCDLLHYNLYFVHNRYCCRTVTPLSPLSLIEFGLAAT